MAGALIRNRDLHFICEHIHVRVETSDTPYTNEMQPRSVRRIPIAHAEGNYVCDDETLAELRHKDRIVFRYCDANGNVTEAANPNGSRDNIAGICNVERNVLGLMPHPERACEDLLGSSDGRDIFRSLAATLALPASYSLPCSPAISAKTKTTAITTMQIPIQKSAQVRP